MPTFRYGIKQLTISEIDADGVTPINTEDVTEYVYQKTFEVTEAEAAITEHKAENNIYSSIILKEAAPEIGKVTLFNFPLALKEKLKGGTSATINDKTTYEHPNENTIVERQITFVTKDNVSVTYVRAFVDANKDFKGNDTEVERLKLTLIPMLPTDNSEAIIEKEL